MVLDKLKSIFSGVKSGDDLSNVAKDAGLGDLGGYAKYLQGITYPVSKDEVINAIKANGGNDELVDKVNQYSGDKFNSAQDVIKQFTK